ncbi:hypothetical protein [Leptospira perdikensis]|uniref:Uncharacterized protein n=1 Tax=Leptospira perdikensis TaxID=2484948 RepID=A0A4R9JDD0_9LEPT|nr:hypothetical protein [Leptospira perdikensis]TGL37603.1 hypothetical protein EHQ49_15395 [Leptospira perdikensis]
MEKLKIITGVFPIKTLTSDDSARVFIPISIMGFLVRCQGILMRFNKQRNKSLMESGQGPKQTTNYWLQSLGSKGSLFGEVF